jgi:hypothetical protein
VLFRSVWFPINYLMVESLRSHHRHYGEELKIEMPAGSGRCITLGEAAGELSHRLISIFQKSEKDGGRRPVFGGETIFQKDPHWRDNLLFYEYFHGDNGAGIGASHQTGWTALVVNLLKQTKG